MLPFSGKRVFVTGSARRLGREIALAFAREGADIGLHYNSSEKEVHELAKEIKELGRLSCTVKADVRNLDEIDAAIKKVAGVLGGIDILINNAAIFYKTPAAGVSENTWDDFMDVNLRAPFFFVKAALPFLRRSEPGRVINIADTYGLSPSANYVPYGVSKAGLIAMTKGLAKELSPDVLVNCVCPGVIQMQDARCKMQGTDKAISSTLLKRAVKLEDVVGAVLFLAKNNSITGQAIFVDGGKHV